MMKRIIYTVVTLSILFLFEACRHSKQESIDENVQSILKDFIVQNDFASSMWIEDSLVCTYSTCLSATLYDIDTGHYITLVLHHYPYDVLYSLNNTHPIMHYTVMDKDLFVYNHTRNENYRIFPQNQYAERMAKKMLSTYSDNVFDDRIVMQTYKYYWGGSVRMEIDSTFDFTQLFTD